MRKMDNQLDRNTLTWTNCLLQKVLKLQTHFANINRLYLVISCPLQKSYKHWKKNPPLVQVVSVKSLKDIFSYEPCVKVSKPVKMSSLSSLVQLAISLEGGDKWRHYSLSSAYSFCPFLSLGFGVGRRGGGG